MNAFIKKYRGVISIFVCLAIALIVFQLNITATPNANKALAIAIFIIGLWISESIPMPVVALLPIVLFPLFAIKNEVLPNNPIIKIDDVAKHYGNPVVFLFLGGFMLGLAIEKWNLHKRIALTIVNITGSSGNRILLGFLIATGFLSMWLSNTATTMMLFPIALSVIKVMDESSVDGNKSNFSISLLLIIAYASNFGGMATIIGTPPNVSFIAYLSKNHNINIGFFQWMQYGLPIAILLCTCLFFVLTKILFPNKIKNSIATNIYIKNELNELGKLSKTEARVLIVFACTALLWICKDIIKAHTIINLDDNIIAVLGAFILFLVNAGVKDSKGNELQLLEWEDTSKMAWGILLLFGGGIALAEVLGQVGVLKQIGLGLKNLGIDNLFVLILLITIVSIFLSEVMSNVAQVIVFSPIIGSFALEMGMNPFLLGLPMTMAASAASMLPMGTPPNAIVFSSKKIKLKQMLLVGFVMNIIAIIVITLLTYFVGK